jgi:predicted porin
MKKLQIVGLAACAPLAALAQSSAVTIAGAADSYVNHARGSLTKNTQLLSGGNSTTRIIIRGFEDLGGGWRAGFWLEGGLTINDGRGQAITNVDNAGTNQAAGPQNWGRRAIVTLRNPWGELVMGRERSPAYDVFTSRFDVFGVGSGIALNYSASINNTIVRVSNSIGYETPRNIRPFSGFVQHWRGGNPASGNGNGSGLRLHFDQGPFGAVAHYAKTNLTTGDAEFKGIAGIYDFGSFKLSANYQTAERGPTIDQKGALIGVRVPVGGHEFKASYSNFENETATTNPKAYKLAVGFVYNLSKRTAIYTTLASINNSSGSTLAFTGSTTAANQSSQGFDLGIRHDF